MQLFNYIFSRKTRSCLIITALFISVLLTTGSCKADFNVALEDYLSAVAGGKVIAVRIDDARVEYGTPVDFSYQKIGISSDPKTLTIENIGQVDMTVSAILVDMMGIAGTPYSLNMGDLELPITLQPGESSTFEVVFNPTVVGSISSGGHEELLEAAITIASNDAEYSAFSIPLTGTGALGEIAVYQNSSEYMDNGDPFYFDRTDNGVSTDTIDFAIKNIGPVGLTLSGLSSDNISRFSVSHSVSNGQSIAPGESIDFSASFTPDVEGGFPCTVTILSDDKDESSFEFNLKGGTSIPAMIDDIVLWLDAENIDPVDDCINYNTKEYVEIWKDKASNPHDASPRVSSGETLQPGETGSNAHTRRLPEYVAASDFNGKPAVRFVDEDGLTDKNSVSYGDVYYNGDVLLSSGTMISSSNPVPGLSIFYVMRLNGAALDSGGRTYMYAGTPVYLRTYSNRFYTKYMNMLFESDDINIAPERNKNYLISHVLNNDAVATADTFQAWINGTSINPGRTFEDDISITYMYVGNHPSAYNVYCVEADFAEIIYFSKTLSDVEVGLIHSYLNNKYTLW